MTHGHSLSIAALAFVCIFGSALFAMRLGAALPEHHLNNDSKDVVKLGIGLVGTIAALALSLLISSAKSTFDRTSDELVQRAANAVTLDRVLADSGPETGEVRDLMKRSYTPSASFWQRCCGRSGLDADGSLRRRKGDRACDHGSDRRPGR